MVTVAVKKAAVKKITTPAKPGVVPAKTIATAASKVSAVKAVVKAKPPVSAKAPEKMIKPAPPVKAVAKLEAKPAAKKTVKVAAKPLAVTATKAAAIKEKAKKTKLVRDSFTMPEAEYAVLSQVKKACLSAGVEAKKSQLLRVGLLLLSKTDVANLKTLIASLEPLKAGRPKKDK